MEVDGFKIITNIKLVQIFFSSLMAQGPACVQCAGVEKVYKQWGTDSRPWEASFLSGSNCCHPTGAPSSFTCSEVTVPLGLDGVGGLFCVSRLVFLKGYPSGQVLAQPVWCGAKDMIWLTSWCGYSPSAWLWKHPGFTQVTLSFCIKLGKYFLRDVFLEA